MFRLISLKILRHRVLGNINLTFCQDNSQELHPEDIYTSVVIGVNGIGKSYLMRAIADIFSYLDGLKAGRVYKKSPVDYKFSVKYRFGSAIYEFTNIGEFEPAGRAKRNYMYTTCKRNAEEIEVRQMEAPARIIASTMTVTDKFTTVNSGNYIYKGIRNENSPGTTGTRTLIRKTVNGLLHSLDVKVGFQQELKELLKHMGLSPKLEILFLKPNFLDEK